MVNHKNAHRSGQIYYTLAPEPVARTPVPRPAGAVAPPVV